jgi:NADPH-dependent 2,4-dienoyl-CoA reductase/sulfur reductase-like enzyme
MRRLVEALAGGPCRVTVIGGGLIGVETAATLAAQGHEVTVLDLLERPFDRMHDPLPAIAAATLQELGIVFVGGAAIDEVVPGPGGRVTGLYEGGSVTADVLVAAMGGRVVAPPGLAADDAVPASGAGTSPDPASALRAGTDAAPGPGLPLEVGPDLAVPGLDRVHAAGDLVLVPHARFGPIRFPHWDAAIGTGEQAADAIAGVAGPYERLPYWWSDIGPRRLAEVGWAAAATTWTDEDGIHVGRDAGDSVVAALVVDEPRRLREARALVLGEP